MRNVDNKVDKINTLFVLENTIYKLTFGNSNYCYHCCSYIDSKCCCEVDCSPEDRDDELDLFVEK